ncbi:hypothetical protein CC86DRAFT_454310 [Ophiobolus disseminans]|uniref:CMP/dCMP-type deaminase domain-containing protein n=1 Tax=Ophiobolus disseminans TaxID=1469910 RepID=A0A6A7A5W3_9PLEO|nr:hypothetical protein CC86DRAFT_454310 [Ophiobolus disseminans]
MAELKEKHKLKQEPKLELEEETTKTFTPFEMMAGGGKLVNTPLSMHSEMMAIHSALSVASTVASSAVHLKNRASNYRVVMNEKLDYDERQSNPTSRQSSRRQSSPARSTATAGLRFKSGGLNPLHLDCAALSLEFQLEEQEAKVASSAMNSVEKHQMKNAKKNYHHKPGNKYKDGQHIQHVQQYAYKSSARHSIVAPCHSTYDTKPVREDPHKSSVRRKVSPEHKRQEKAPPVASKSQPILLPKGQTGQNTRSVRERTKLPRLNGADVYVARLGWKTQSDALKSVACCKDTEESAAGVSLSCPSTGSLHDELLDRGSRSQPVSKSTKASDNKVPSVLASRPCYRCISYMSSVGIKRVFWTTDAGTWEGAKVRDLVAAIDKLGDDQLSDATTALNSVLGQIQAQWIVDS